MQAGWYFRRGQHTLAARYYAKTPCCFEEIGDQKSTRLSESRLQQQQQVEAKYGELSLYRVYTSNCEMAGKHKLTPPLDMWYGPIGV